MRSEPRMGTYLGARLAAALLLAAASGCGGSSNGNGSGNGGNGPPGPGPGEPPLEAQFSSIQSQVFDQHCTACHAGAAAPRGLRLTADDSFALLVGVPSDAQPQFDRVSPGNPDDSYLIMALEGRADAIPRMPDETQGGAPLPQETIDVIRQWILDGAPPPAESVAEEEAGDPYDPGEASAAVASVSARAAAVTITGHWPADRATLSAPPRFIVLGASGELDVSALHAYSVWLSRPDEIDPSSGQPRRVEGITVRAPVLAPTTILLDVSAVDWSPGSYAVHVAGSGPYAVADRNARLVDGNGDGRPGGDFVLHFTLDAER